MATPDGLRGPGGDAATIASAILDRADRDIAFVVRITGESQYLLVQHFHTAIERALAQRGVGYGDHPLLRLLIETHARELAEFVTSAAALDHQLGLRTVERLKGDPVGLMRADLWDSLRSSIEAAERHLTSPAGGLNAIVTEIETLRREADAS